MQDLELNTLLSSMAAGDPLLFDVAQRALLLSLSDPEAIVYRQQVLADCLAQPAVMRELYALAGEALRAQKTVWGSLLRDSPRTALATSVAKMELFVELSQATALHGRRTRGEVHIPGVHAILCHAP